MAFMVRLAKIDINASRSGHIIQSASNVVQRVMTIYFRLTGSEQVQIGAIQNENYVRQFAFNSMSKIIGKPDTGDSISIFFTEQRLVLITKVIENLR